MSRASKSSRFLAALQQRRDVTGMSGIKLISETREIATSREEWKGAVIRFVLSRVTLINTSHTIILFPMFPLADRAASVQTLQNNPALTSIPFNNGLVNFGSMSPRVRFLRNAGAVTVGKAPIDTANCNSHSGTRCRCTSGWTLITLAPNSGHSYGA